MTSTITLDAGQCIKCGACVLTCPMEVYTQEPVDKVPEATGLERCISCGHCVAVCPGSAIKHSVFGVDKVNLINQSNLPSANEIAEFLRTRRSVRIFQEKPVEKEVIQKIIEAAQLAPSAHNRQTTRYIVVQDKRVLEDIVKASSIQMTKMVGQLKNPLIRSLLLAMMRTQAQTIVGLTPALERLARTLNEGRDGILHNAPVLILFHADERQLLIDINAQLSIQNAALMAYALGLGSFYTGYLLSVCQRDKSIGKLVGLPEHHKIYGGLAVGYPKFQYQSWIVKKPAEIKWI
jgi:nitroreductase/Pyruvate/2-oxoacid:ferredoxin oxidoreductase delta subunit